MIITYDNYFDYLKSRMPNACKVKGISHGDRTAYILSSDSKDLLSDLYKVNLYNEYDTTLNVYEDGYVNLMKMRYDYYDEEWKEDEVKVLSQKEFDNIELRRR